MISVLGGIFGGRMRREAARRAVKADFLTALKDYGLVEAGVHAEDMLERHYPIQRINAKIDIQNFSRGVLKELQPGETYFEKSGDADYMRQRAGDHGLVGWQERRSEFIDAYRRAGNGSMKIIMDQSPLRKSKVARDNAKRLIGTGAEVRTIDAGLRGIGVRKADGAALCVWSSATSDEESSYGQPHRPEESVYNGFIFHFENNDTGNHIPAFKTYFDVFLAEHKKLWDDAKDAKEFISSTESNLEAHSRRLEKMRPSPVPNSTPDSSEE